MRGSHLKILCLSLLALVGVMAVSASAAQAKWLLLLSKASVLKQTFEFTINPAVFAVPGLGIEIACTGGTGTDFTQLNEAHTVQSGGAIAKFTGCKDVTFGEVCTLASPGEPVGTIVTSGTGSGSMEGEKVLVTTASSEFAKIQFFGEECPFTELDGKVVGSVTVEIADPLKDTASHEVEVVKYKLTCGGEPVTFQAPGGGNVSGTLSTTTSQAAATHLVGL